MGHCFQDFRKGQAAQKVLENQLIRLHLEPLLNQEFQLDPTVLMVLVGQLSPVHQEIQKVLENLVLQQSQDHQKVLCYQVNLMVLTVPPVLSLLLGQVDQKDLEIHQDLQFQGFLMVLKDPGHRKDQVILEIPMVLTLLVVLHLLLVQLVQRVQPALQVPKVLLDQKALYFLVTLVGPMDQRGQYLQEAQMALKALMVRGHQVVLAVLFRLNLL